MMKDERKNEAKRERRAFRTSLAKGANMTTR